jgi:hypothetical protein
MPLTTLSGDPRLSPLEDKKKVNLEVVTTRGWKKIVNLEVVTTRGWKRIVNLKVVTTRGWKKIVNLEVVTLGIMEAAESVAGWMGGEHDKAALEQLSKRKERTFTYVNERIF